MNCLFIYMFVHVFYTNTYMLLCRPGFFSTLMESGQEIIEANILRISTYQAHLFEKINPYFGCLKHRPRRVWYLPERVLRQFSYVQAIPGIHIRVKIPRWPIRWLASTTCSILIVRCLSRIWASFLWLV